MPERVLGSPEDMPPRRWHDALRNELPGNMITEDKFSSMPVTEPNGFAYTIISLTKDDPVTTLPEGIYIYTNLHRQFESIHRQFTVPVLEQIRKIVLKNPGEPEIVPVRMDLHPELARRGAFINIADSMGLKIAAYTSSGAIVFSVNKVGPNGLKGLILSP